MRQGVSFPRCPRRSARRRSTCCAPRSARRAQQTRDIMRLNYTLGELNNNNFDRYGEWLYHITVMGEPSATRAVGLADRRPPPRHQLLRPGRPGGDDAVLRWLRAGDRPHRQVHGHDDPAGRAEPGSGVHQRAARGAARRRRSSKVDKTGNNNLTEAFKDNVVIDYAGVKATELSAAQRRELLVSIALFVGNMDDGHAKVKMDEVGRQLDARRSRGSARRRRMRSSTTGSTAR